MNRPQKDPKSDEKRRDLAISGNGWRNHGVLDLRQANPVKHRTDWLLWLAAVLMLIGIVLVITSDPADSTAPPQAPVAASQSAPRVSDTLRVLDKLRSYGYTINTETRALRAIRAWQKANGLTIDGIVGPETLGSLNLTATATVPAVRIPSPASPSPGPVGGSVEQIIRDVWPDDLEDWAVRIATRESNLQPDAHNSCCHGLFQIHFTAHRAWLSDYGVYQPSDLYDPRVNSIVALALYQQAGPGPWAL